MNMLVPKQKMTGAVRGEGGYGGEEHIGHVDFYGYITGAGWMFCGWIRNPPTTVMGEIAQFRARFQDGEHAAEAVVAFFHRPDLGTRGIGVVIFSPGPRASHRQLVQLSGVLGPMSFLANAGTSASLLTDVDLRARLRPILLEGAFDTPIRRHLLRLVARPAYTGQDSLAALPGPVLIEIDEAIMCPPNGLLLMGWMVAPPDETYSLRLRSGHLGAEFSLDDAIRIARPDVVAAVADRIEASDANCGFLVYVADAFLAGEDTYIEVEAASGQIGFKGVRLSPRRGINAMKRLLEVVDVRYRAVDAAFDKVLGPAITALNADRLRLVTDVDELRFGEIPTEPEVSIIVPLYGRVDFVEYQLALFSRHESYRRSEIIYVLDDPSKRRELESLCQSLYPRFGIPFRLLTLSRNVGFGPANNFGLRAARGRYICFLNSDVFPGTDDWVPRLVKRLRDNPDIGVIGPRLLFEDGSVQHEGCVHRPIPEFGDWQFVDHVNKGLRPSEETGLRRFDVITGACMLLEKRLADELGGWDEMFAVGDFEDADLCMKIRARGLSCAVDHEAFLYHLERKSQVGPSQQWRMNVTLYNAWVYQRRWCPNGVPTALTSTHKPITARKR